MKYNTKRNKLLLVLGSVFYSLSTNAGVFNLTPPNTLIIDSQVVSEAIFTLEALSGFDKNLLETVVLLDRADPSDDISNKVRIGSGIDTTFLTYDELFPITQFDFTADITSPGIGPISSSVLSAQNEATFSLPSLSTTTNFFQIIDFAGNTTFSSVEASLSRSLTTGFLNIDLLGDGTIFAIVNEADVLASINFKDHGTVRVVPIPAAIWLFGSGLLGLLGVSMGKIKKRGEN